MNKKEVLKTLQDIQNEIIKDNIKVLGFETIWGYQKGQFRQVESDGTRIIKITISDD